MDTFLNRSKIMPYIQIGKSYHSNPCQLNTFCTLSIVLQTLRFIMLTTIQFNS